MSSGDVVQVIGAVVDVKFTSNEVPKIFDALNIENSEIVLEIKDNYK